MIYASIGAVISGVVVIRLYQRQFYGKPTYITPEFRHQTALQQPYPTSSYQAAGYPLHIRITLGIGLFGASNSYRANPVINRCFRAAFLSFEGAPELQSRHRHPIAQWTMAGVLMLLTAYKLLSYRNQMNHT